MDTIRKLNELLNERDMSVYALAKLCNLNYCTLNNATKRHTQLSVDTIEKICAALGLETYEFFMDEKDWEVIEQYALRRRAI